MAAYPDDTYRNGLPRLSSDNPLCGNEMNCRTTPSLFFLLVALLFPSRSSGQEVEALSLDSLLNLSVSTAAKYDQKTEEAPASVTIIPAEQIASYGYNTIAEVLGAVRGFYLANDHQRTYVGTRGFNRMLDQNNRVRLLLNGHTLNEGTYGSAPLDKDFGLDLDMVERIEVVRGPGSVLYGTGAMFAVVNVITKSAPTNDGLTILGDGGSFGYARSSFTFVRAYSDLKIFATGELTQVDGQDLYFKEFDSPATKNGIAHQRDWSNSQGGMVRAIYFNLNVASQPLLDHMRRALRLNNIFDTRYYVPSGRQHIQDRIVTGWAQRTIPNCDRSLILLAAHCTG